MVIGDSDFAPVSFLRLSFPPGSSTSLQSSLIAIIDDSIVEEPETFQVNLTSSDPRVAVIIQDNTVTIVDNDGKRVILQVVFIEILQICYTVHTRPRDVLIGVVCVQYYEQ